MANEQMPNASCKFTQQTVNKTDSTAHTATHTYHTLNLKCRYSTCCYILFI